MSYIWLSKVVSATSRRSRCPLTRHTAALKKSGAVNQLIDIVQDAAKAHNEKTVKTNRLKPLHEELKRVHEELKLITSELKEVHDELMQTRAEIKLVSDMLAAMSALETGDKESLPPYVPSSPE
jgi:septal ring factor EnvC (AmiA/AmiB activator)